jgi:MFS family permease
VEFPVSSPASTPPPQKLTFTVWLIVIMAAIGFAFDIYAIVMAQFIVGPAMQELGGFSPQSEEGRAAITLWRSLLVYVPALAGGVFGLLGGYLTDLLGRRRVLTGSILLYAGSAFLSGYSTSLTMLLVLRSLTFIGVCVEFVAAVAWLAELFDNPHQRERVLGYTQAFSSLGGLLVAIAFGICARHSTSFWPLQLPDFLANLVGQVKSGQAAWRYTLLSGVIPAVPLILIRPFLPESPKWRAKKEAGTLKRPSILALFAPAFRRTTVVTTLMFACSYGAAFGAIQHIPEMVKGLPEVKKEVAEKPAEKNKIEQTTAAAYGKVQELGGLVGRFLLALLVVRIVSRRALLRTFLVPGLVIFPLVFYGFLQVPNTEIYTVDLEWLYLGHLPITTVSIGVFLAGLVAVAQFSFWGNYLPGAYPLHLRGTGESFAANVGGRAIGVGFWGVTNFLAYQVFSGLPGGQPQSFTYAAAVTGLFVFAAGLVLSFFLPEPKQTDMSQ